MCTPQGYAAHHFAFTTQPGGHSGMGQVFTCGGVMEYCASQNATPELCQMSVACDILSAFEGHQPFLSDHWYLQFRLLVIYMHASLPESSRFLRTFVIPNLRKTQIIIDAIAGGNVFTPVCHSIQLSRHPHHQADPHLGQTPLQR